MVVTDKNQTVESKSLPDVAYQFKRVVVPAAVADEPDRKWLDFFEGEWTYESSTGRKGEIDLQYVPGRFAMIGTKPGARWRATGWLAAGSTCVRGHRIRRGWHLQCHRILGVR